MLFSLSFLSPPFLVPGRLQEPSRVHLSCQLAAVAAQQQEHQNHQQSSIASLPSSITHAFIFTRTLALHSWWIVARERRNGRGLGNQGEAAPQKSRRQEPSFSNFACASPNIPRGSPRQHPVHRVFFSFAPTSAALLCSALHGSDCSSSSSSLRLSQALEASQQSSPSILIELS